ncbi:MAG: lactate dehydrogenase [Clostridia bacterium]|nr:lactate dehydrogenase [Clostridia bacterium]
MKIKCYYDSPMTHDTMVQACEEFGFEYVATEGPATMEDFKTLKGQDIDVILVSVNPMSTEEYTVLKDAGVKHVVSMSVGFDHFDKAAAKEIGIGIHHSSYPPATVASYAVMLMLMSARRYDSIERAYKGRDFRVTDALRGNDPSELTFGVIGTGKIGAAVCNRLRGFEPKKILCYDIYQNESLKEFCEYVSLEELLAQSDIVTLHAFASPENYHLINAERLALMKPTAYIVNTARGSLVDAEALADAIENGKLGGAALDVLEVENGVYYCDKRGQELPAIMKRLEEMPEVIMTQHMAFCSTLTGRAQIYEAIKTGYLAMTGQPNPNEVK